MVGLHVIEYLLRVPWVWGFPWGFQWGFLWVWDVYGDWNAIPTAALVLTLRCEPLLVTHCDLAKLWISVLYISVNATRCSRQQKSTCCLYVSVLCRSVIAVQHGSGSVRRRSDWRSRYSCCCPQSNWHAVSRRREHNCQPRNAHLHWCQTGKLNPFHQMTDRRSQSATYIWYTLPVYCLFAWMLKNIFIIH